MNPHTPFLKAKQSGLPWAVFATHPGGMSIHDPCLDFVFPLPLPLPFPLGYFVGCSGASDADRFPGRGVALGFGCFAGIGMRYGMSSGDVLNNLISLSKGVTKTPGSACSFPTRLLEARMKICLSHSMICCKVTVMRTLTAELVHGKEKGAGSTSRSHERSKVLPGPLQGISFEKHYASPTLIPLSK